MSKNYNVQLKVDITKKQAQLLQDFINAPGTPDQTSTELSKEEEKIIWQFGHASVQGFKEIFKAPYDPVNPSVVNISIPSDDEMFFGFGVLVMNINISNEFRLLDHLLEWLNSDLVSQKMTNQVIGIVIDQESCGNADYKVIKNVNHNFTLVDPS